MSRANEDTKVPRGNYRGKHTANPGYQPMNHWVVCDSCGFDIRASDIRETWDNRLVCPSDWEPRHPQDFVRGRTDDQSAKGPVRPPPTDILIDSSCGDPVTFATAGTAIAGLAVSGNTECQVVYPPIPGGSFNPNII